MMGRIVKRGKRFGIQNTHTGEVRRTFSDKDEAEEELKKLRRRFRNK